MNLQHADAMVEFFGIEYKKRYGFKPELNRVQAPWDIYNMSKDLKIGEIKRLIEYYFRTESNNKHSWQFFCYHYPELYKMMRRTEQDRQRTQQLMEETKKRVLNESGN